ncbi:MAG: peptidase M15D vanX D-ala-D-ala dipeptidase [Chitinivibrionales bacterium]|nr:peptidase M15D vanX D-ala-D-ala dipeptidase [Chitinivibrionales bacterium]
MHLNAAEPAYSKTVPLKDNSAAYERKLVGLGFVDVRTLDSTIRVELKYGGTDNFMKADVYGGLKKCYLRRPAAEILAAANAYLKQKYPHLRILVADGFRPRRVQRKMWNLVKNTAMQNYVANPKWGSMHNYGCAVDVTIADTNGIRLDMGCPIDHFGPLSQPRLEKKYLQSGRLTKQQVANRHILRDAMTQAGFLPLAIEWWHFNAFDKKAVRKRYDIVE